VTWTAHERVVGARRRFAVVDIGVEVVDAWRRHLTGRNAAVLTYYGFLSVFPLFLVGTTILALVLEDNPDLQEDILDTAISQLPVIGTTIVDNAGRLEGSVWTIVIGLLVAVWASMKAFVGAQTAFDDAWEVHVDRRDNFVVKRLKALIGIAIIGAAQIGGTALSTVASLGDVQLPGRAGLLTATVALNAVLLAAMYRFLSARAVTWRMVWPGALLGGIGFTALQVAGATIVDRYLRRAEDISGVFATVFALLAWMSLHAIVSLVGIELNAALDRRRSTTDSPTSPRSGPTTDSTTSPRSSPSSSPGTGTAAGLAERPR
jgi:membrane protein